MAKELVSRYICSSCGRSESKWLGRCPDCGQWNTFTEETIRKTSKKQGKINENDAGAITAPIRLNEVQVEPEFRFATGISELDRVLGGGIMRGSSILVGGEPGIGKSTLMIQLLANCGVRYPVLYVSGEESAGQIKLRAERLGLDLSVITMFCDTRIDPLMDVMRSIKPVVMVVDSLQTLSTNELTSLSGSPAQIRACTLELTTLAKQLGTTLFIVGHVTKEGVLAGPKVIEHMVDTVLYFDQAGSGVRLIRAIKNRYGSVDEIGLFHMNETGLHPVNDPSGFFISERASEVAVPAGIAYTAVVEGTRTFLVEIQALTVPAKSGFSRVYSDRIESARVTRVAAVLERHAGVRFNDQDIYVNVAGGMKLSEVSIELPLACALWSAVSGKALPEKLVSYGELTLAGEVRSVGFSEKREKAAFDMGFNRLLVPYGTKLGSRIKSIQCATVKDIIKALS